MYKIRKAEPTDLNAIIQLQKLSLGEGQIPRSLEFWNWKHEQNPFGSSPTLLAINNKEEIVGLRTFMQWKWQLGEHVFKAYRAVDTSTHPQWQGKGIFKNLTLTLLEEVKASGADFIFNTPNTKSLPGYLKMGWKELGKPSLWIKPIYNPFRWFGFHKKEVIPQIPNKFKAGNLDYFPNRFGLAEAGKVFCPKTEAYFIWRYVHIPEFEYFAIREKNDYCFGRLKITFNKLELRLTDMHISGNETASVLFGKLFELAKQLKVTFLSIMDDGNEHHQKLFRKYGFFQLKNKSPMVVIHPLSIRGNDLPDAMKWAWQTGDLELF